MDKQQKALVKFSLDFREYEGVEDNVAVSLDLVKNPGFLNILASFRRFLLGIGFKEKDIDPFILFPKQMDVETIVKSDRKQEKEEIDKEEKSELMIDGYHSIIDFVENSVKQNNSKGAKIEEFRILFNRNKEVREILYDIFAEKLKDKEVL